MEHHFTLSGTALTVHLPAELDHCSSQQLRQEIDRLIRVRNIRSILFDFGNTEFMDSSGIGMLLTSYKSMRFMAARSWSSMQGNGCVVSSPFPGWTNLSTSIRGCQESRI